LHLYEFFLSTIAVAIAIFLIPGASKAELGQIALRLFINSIVLLTILEETRKIVKLMQEQNIVLPTEAKAVLINMDKNKAGYIVEVGTAQEVVTFIDHGGQRSNTILNSASYNGKSSQ